MMELKKFIDRASRWLDSTSHICFVFISLMTLSFLISKDNMGYCFFVFSILFLVLKYHSYIKKIYFSVKNGEVSIELTDETKESFSKLGFECYDDLLNTVTADNVAEFKRKKLSLALMLQNANGQKVEVDSLSDYEKYTEKGYYACTTYDVKTQTYYDVVRDFLEYILTINAKCNVLNSLLDQPAIRVLSSINPDFDTIVGNLSVREFLEQNNGTQKMNDDWLELNIDGEGYYFKILSKLTVIENFYEEYFISGYYQFGGTHGHSYDLKLRKTGSSVELL